MAVGKHKQTRPVGVRLPIDIDERIKDHAISAQLSYTEALVSLVRKGLGIDDEPPPETALALLTLRVEALEEKASYKSSNNSYNELLNGHDKQPGAALAAGWVFPPFKTAVHFWGKRCENGHNNGENEAMRYLKGKQACVICQRENDRKSRARKARIAAQ